MTFKTSYKVGLAVLLCYLVAWLDRMAINMTIPFIRDELEVGPEQIGWILSAFFLGYSLFQIPGGMLADRIGPRKVILAALAWWSVFTALTGVVGGLVSMLAVRFLFGIAISAPPAPPGGGGAEGTRGERTARGSGEGGSKEGADAATGLGRADAQDGKRWTCSPAYGVAAGAGCWRT